jgi:6-phosphofructokinase 1
MDAVRAARNANVCLVPEFSYDLYGENGLLRYISERVRLKGYCIIVYSEGASYAVNDIPKETYAEILRRKESTEDFAFDLFLKQEIERELARRQYTPHSVYLFDSQNAVRTVPANSFDTKLCWYFSYHTVKSPSAASRASCQDIPILELGISKTEWLWFPSSK